RRQLSAGGAALLARQPWRGNVRELRNVIFRLALLARDDVIDEAAIEPLLAGDVPPLPRAGEAGLFPGEADGEGMAGDGREDFATALARFIEEARPEAGTLYDAALAAFERPLFLHALAQTGGNQLRAAQLLGINRNTLRKRLGDLGIAPEDALTIR
ncbi:MAG TPA: hypothetical protein EYH41_14700, partial [Novosphingobium capsulatum]|nr:hypothetical protein [Novosphingobium capsulatum]